jgi:hypothetical protein
MRKIARTSTGNQTIGKPVSTHRGTDISGVSLLELKAWPIRIKNAAGTQATSHKTVSALAERMTLRLANMQ